MRDKIQTAHKALGNSHAKRMKNKDRDMRKMKNRDQ